ncbi:hypothetical protein CNBJ0650 [Cryptococcus deneoformans B-3501A]|uniref:hypothetical protein n=1 Tax=Cryptococcus deneoformans (strain B-3501A) TaxID=283643 RepID=UPI0000430320|nr:hypothetical protein CNBJ0650 [Cryptococcus neoformans var. neoformans B-3501A]EAL18640.1 hypothetical protein CNBJ0650 [Cryptococcus neoformans var. neoformans B-3501A]
MVLVERYVCALSFVSHKSTRTDGLSTRTDGLIGYFPTTYEPTVFENYVEMIQVDDQVVELSLWDTAGQEDFDRLRSLSYADTHVVMICFSAMDSRSQSILSRSQGNPYRPLKCDLREDPGVKERLGRRSLHPVTYDEGLATARAIRASRYLECSAKHNRGVQEAVYEAARVAVGSRARGGGSGGRRGDGWKEKCIIL